MNLPADKKLRLTRSKDIQRIFTQGRRVLDGRITLLAMRRDEAGAASRVGVAVSVRCGNAVRRNRIKRLAREAFRLSRPDLPAGWDFIIVPRAGAEFSLDSLAKSIKSLVKRCTREQTDKDAAK
jgi:ribonuclease P protein component